MEVIQAGCYGKQRNGVRQQQPLLPCFLGNNEIAVFGSYGAGGGRIRIDFNGNDYTAILVESHKAMEGIVKRSADTNPVRRFCLVGNA